jgi:nucleotide-binding universal stress UspA family protein
MALSFGVASDGSRLSQLAQEFAAGMIKRRGVDDSLSALHITPRPEKLDLVPDHLKPSKLEADAVEFAREQDLDIKWVTQQREVGMSTGDALCKLVQDAGCDFTCVGSYGRKDPDDPDHIGSTGSEPLKYVSLETYSLATHFLTHT